jgi:formylglycine-generating enzyme required for sulfatase activity
MRRVRTSVYVVTALLALLAACAPQTAVPTPTDTPTPAPAQPPAADTDTPTPASAQPTETSATATLEPVSLVPPMAVGSEFRYFDGALLEAVPAGPFTMGKKGGTDNPEHVVTLDDYWIYRTKVTNQQYARCVALGLCTPPDLTDNLGYTDPLRVNDPVSGVTWDQAGSYCTYAHARLPTEAEWEKAGRGPVDVANIYAWGNGAPDCDLLNFNNCVGKTTDVNLYPEGKSYYNLFDMDGNAFEWVADWYDGFFYRDAKALNNPFGPDDGQRRSVRSSSFKSNNDQIPLFTRFYDDPTHHRRDLGFRCVVLDPGFFAPACDFIAYVGSDVSGGQVPQAVPTPDCPALSGTSAGFCDNNVPGGIPASHVNLGPDPFVPGAPPNNIVVTFPGSCHLDPAANTTGDYYCNGGGSFNVTADCTVPPPPVPAGCPAGWTESPPGNCHYTGGGTGSTECPPGGQYDPVNHCCTSTPGTATDFNLCPSDAPYYVGGICVPWPSTGTALKTVTITLGNCEHGGNNPCPTTDPNYPNCTPGGACPNPPTCYSPYHLDLIKCACVLN